MSAGKVEIGAFRTFPAVSNDMMNRVYSWNYLSIYQKGYKAPDEGPSEYQTIPLNKIEDFGVHAKS